MPTDAGTWARPATTETGAPRFKFLRRWPRASFIAPAAAARCRRTPARASGTVRLIGHDRAVALDLDHALPGQWRQCSIRASRSRVQCQAVARGAGRPTRASCSAWSCTTASSVLLCPLRRFDEVLVRPRRCRTALALILRADLRTAVRMFGRTGQPQQAQLADLHSRPQRDRQVRDVGQLQRDVAAEARVDEPGRKWVSRPAGPATTCPPADPPDRRAGCTTRGSSPARTPPDAARTARHRRLDQAGQLVLLDGWVDVGVRVLLNTRKRCRGGRRRWTAEPGVVERLDAQRRRRFRPGCHGRRAAPDERIRSSCYPS